MTAPSMHTPVDGTPTTIVGIDALILGGDGRPMPLGGLARGRFSVHPDLPDHPPAPEDEQVTATPTSTACTCSTGPDLPSGWDRLWEPRAAAGACWHTTPEEPQRASDQLPPERPADRVREMLAGGADLDGVLRAGLTPAEICAHVDASTIRRLVPQLDASGAADVARLLGDPRVVRMLDETWRDPPDGHRALAGTQDS